MKNLFIVLLFVIGGIVTTSGQVIKVLSRSIDLENTHTMYVMLPGAVTTTEWEEDYLRVTTTIQVDNITESVVKRLMVIGRYNLETKTDKYKNRMVLTMPNAANYISIKGVGLVEEYKFEVNVPKGYTIVVKDNLNPNSGTSSQQSG